ncbi:MAG: hypothetical protein ACQESF_01005 [Nanobdellota archaeon]
MKKAVVFTIDALLAGMICMLIISSIFIQSSKVEQPSFSSVDLYNLGGDVLVVLKNKGLLSKALKDDKLVRQKKLLTELFPYNVCYVLKVNGRTGIELKSFYKPGCENTLSKNKIRSATPFVYNGKIYSADIVMWYK